MNNRLFLMLTLVLVVFLCRTGKGQQNRVIHGLDSTLEFTTTDQLPWYMTHRSSENYHWYKSGTIFRTEGGYSGSLLHGSYNSFFSTGQLKSKGGFYFGLKHGKWHYWDKKGDLLRVEIWKKGMLKRTLDTSHPSKASENDSEKQQRQKNNWLKLPEWFKKNETS